MEDKIAVAIPCYNEELTISKVVKDFHEALPDASIYVFDNNSEDNTALYAREAGAVVHTVRKQGKGHVMRAIFDNLDADAVVVVDGDDTYFAEDATLLLARMAEEDADMVVGNRLPSATEDAMIRLHRFGNAIISATINRMFGTAYQDILSGYRVFNRKFIENIPLLTHGFEVETEMTLQALEEGMNVQEIPIRYRNRPEGSESKLRSFTDGGRIMLTAALLLRDHQPLRLFGMISLACWLVVFAAGILRFSNYLKLADFSNSLLTGIILLFAPIAAIAFGVGLTLSAINTRFREMKQIMQRNRKD